MKNIFFIVTLLIMASQLFSQKYFTRTGNISFYSEAPMETIEAKNSNATTIFDAESGAIEWAVLIKAFEFKKALMQTHFNENYMESSKFPKATFKGKIENIETVDFENDGSFDVSVSGELTIHGVSNDVSTSAQFKIENGTITGNSKFNVFVADYEIEIPKLVRDNIAKEVEISISAQYQKLEK